MLSRNYSWVAFQEESEEFVVLLEESDEESVVLDESDDPEDSSKNQWVIVNYAYIVTCNLIVSRNYSCY